MKKDTQSIYDLPQGDLQEEQPRRLRQKKKPRKWLWLTLIVLVVLGAVAAAVLWDANSFDGLRRSIIYARAEKDETGCAKLYYYENDATSRFAAIDGSLVTVAANQVRLLDERSQVLYQNSVRFLHPDLVSGGGVAVAYDIGGTALYALDSKGLRWQQETEGELLAVTVNPHGYVTAVYNKSGAKAAVTVWDSNGAAVFTFQSAQRFVMTAALGQDDRTLAAVTMGQEDGKFQSFLVLYHTDSDKMVATTPVDGGVAYALETLQREFCAVTEQGLYLLDSGGELKASYSYGGQFLRRCVVGDGGWAALLLSRYKSGGYASLITVDGDGNELGGCDIDGEVLDISTAGRYVAVLFSDRLTIYDKYLTEVATLPDVSEVRAVLMRADGSAVLAGASGASLYLP
jgi:DNA-binding beta-propeller fold protein YncE